MEDSTYNKLHSGELYDPSEKKLFLEQLRRLDRLRRFNRTHATLWGLLRRTRMLKRMFGDVGRDCYIEPPLYTNFGGKHVHFGDGVYANFGLTLVDDTHITVGSHTMFGPRVTVVTATHPLYAPLRDRNLQYNKPVRIGESCFIGAGAVILPGVTVGDRAIIGAGSVVTHDIPADTVAAGNPCRVIRAVDARDREVYDRDKPIPDEWRGL